MRLLLLADRQGPEPATQVLTYLSERKDALNLKCITPDSSGFLEDTSSHTPPIHFMSCCACDLECSRPLSSPYFDFTQPRMQLFPRLVCPPPSATAEVGNDYAYARL